MPDLSENFLNQGLGIQYGRRMANIHFFCIFNGKFNSLIMTLLAKKVIFLSFLLAKF